MTPTRSTEDKGKGKAKEEGVISKTETFSQLLMGGEEDFDEYLGANETLDDDEDDGELMSTMDPPLDYDEDDDDKDSLDAWLENDDDQYIEDNEIT